MISGTEKNVELLPEEARKDAKVYLLDIETGESYDAGYNGNAHFLATVPTGREYLAKLQYDGRSTYTIVSAVILRAVD